jgi:signal recognition particle subunit SRP54
MIAADPYRPAASEQLLTLGEELDVPVHSNPDLDPLGVCREGLDLASKGGASVVIIDSAGRSQLDDAMMTELSLLTGQIRPIEVLLVADAMTGQEAVQIAQGFNEEVGLTGIILTKMDGDARGGAAISMRAVTEVPIKWIGVGEDRSALEQFDPERMASRIMGMGDIQGILEVAQEAIDVDQAEAQAARMLSGDFTLEDFSQQLQSMRKMGPIGKILERMPASMVGLQGSIDNEQADRQIRQTQAILQSMTREERRRPDILNGSRKRRIATGSGTSVQQVNVLLRQYKQMRKIMKQVGKGGLPKNLSWPL